MSTQIIAVLVIILAQVLPKIGVTIESKDLEVAITTIATLLSSAWIWYQRVYKLRRTDTPDVGVLGVRK